MPTTLTRQFKNGNSLAVRIPAGMAFAPDNVELLIERVGDELRIRPKGEKLTGLGELFAALAPDGTWTREDHGDYVERDWPDRT
ncbi:MAG: AbrB/MazE/SpoVT family DNA-binding domain-containing protein [Pseudomonadota bacterium]|nr:AbrB/MazE/SpoVT family DNA-binding domain-containing protein [Pseudomonadota bacterium]